MVALSIAQTPQGINYQGIARNSQGLPLLNRSIGIRLSILDSSAIGSAVYVETHNTLTNNSGLFNLSIGWGTTVSGTFDSIQWGQGEKWLRLEMDTTGGINFQMIGTTRFLSVPYALYAKTSGGRLHIGQYYAGGIIFYLDSTDMHGLVCAPNDQGIAEWGCSTSIISGTSEFIGTGFQNTALIVLACSDINYAAKICNDLVLNGYSDWFLPSKFELNLLYKNLADNGWGNFTWEVYWTSTQSTATNSNSISFWPPDDHRFRTDVKNVQRTVRAIRIF